MNKLVKYKENPFLNTTEIKTKGKRISIGNINTHSIIEHETGSVSGISVQSYKEVDTEEFIKLYTMNIGMIFELSTVGIKLFNILMKAIQKYSLNKDTIYLNLDRATEIAKEVTNKGIAKASFYNGIKELIKYQIIAKSTDTNLFFINPNVLFNGDRVSFVNSFCKKQQQQNKNYEENSNFKIIEKKTIDSESEIHRLMIEKYNIPVQISKNIIEKYPTERIKGVMRKIDRLTKIRALKVETASKRIQYFVDCVEQNLTE